MRDRERNYERQGEKEMRKKWWEYGEVRCEEENAWVIFYGA